MKLIFPILFTLISIATFILGVNPLYKDVSSLKSKISEYNLAMSNSTNLLKKEDSLVQSYNSINDSDKQRLNDFLPSAVNNIQFILEIERVANLHNMPIKDIKFDVSKKDSSPTDSNIVVSAVEANTKPYGVFPLSFTTEGTYDQFLGFLKDLELNLRLIDIKSISFAIPDTTDKNLVGVNPNLYSYTLSVETYWLK